MRSVAKNLRAAALVVLLSLGGSATGWGQAYAPADSVTVVPGPQFKAGGLHRTFFGAHYRDLWTTPIRVPVLHPDRFGGGIKPTEKGGGQQTKSLRFRSPDGREYQFRSLTKDPTAVLPPELKHTVAADILKDQMSAGHPAGALVVVPLLDAAGVLNAPPILVQMGDDPSLGEFRAEFAGLLGTIEERPRQSTSEGVTFAGASDIVSSEDLIKKLDDEPRVGVDARAFLLARLTDVFLGDWDRHQDQWRWALVETGGRRRWLPIPRDRDQAFVRYDGFFPAQARRVSPQILNFGSDYGDIVGATWNGRDLDRRMLSGLERPVWDSIATLLTGRLTDEVISRAARSMPPELFARDGARLERALRSRRDGLTKIAAKYYAMLAAETNVYGSDKGDEARVLRGDGGTTVTLSREGTEYFRRTFHAGETKDVRLYLQGGPDRLVVEGEGSTSPTVRAIGGTGDDHYAVTRRGGVHLYDEKGNNTAQGAGINTKPWTWKPDSATPLELPPRDWGRKTLLLLTGYFATDVGAVIDYGGHTDWYGFRRVPYATRLEYRAQYSTAKQSFRFIGGIDRQAENSRRFTRFEVLASGIETLRWYGLGNETPQTGETQFYKLNENVLRAGLMFGARWGDRNHFAIGPEVRWSDADLDSKPNSERFIAIDRPYGTGQFGMAGVAAELQLDSRDFPGFASKGASLRLKASAYPKAWDLEEEFARIEGEGTLALAPQGSWRPSLNLMAGGIKLFGDAPYFEAARIGGRHILRGYHQDRFAGDAAVYGSAEVRLPLTRIKFFLPGQQGVFGFVDAGRVYLKGEDSNEMHTAFGGGFWMSLLSHASLVYIGAGKPANEADKKEGTVLIVGFGFPF